MSSPLQRSPIIGSPGPAESPTAHSAANWSTQTNAASPDVAQRQTAEASGRRARGPNPLHEERDEFATESNGIELRMLFF